MEAELDQIPNEIPVYARESILLRQGDKIDIYGEIFRGDLKIWEKDIVRMFPEHIYNKTLKCGFKKGSRKKILHKGRFHGKITSVFLIKGPIGGDFMYFSIKPDRKIYDVPEEIFVDADEMTLLREGDTVLVDGEIYLQSLKFWEADSIEMRAKHVQNETLNLGF